MALPPPTLVVTMTNQEGLFFKFPSSNVRLLEIFRLLFGGRDEACEEKAHTAGPGLDWETFQSLSRPHTGTVKRARGAFLLSIESEGPI